MANKLRREQGSCWRCCCMGAVAAAVAVAALLLVVVAVVKPRRPEFWLERAEVAEFRLEQSSATAAVLLSLQLRLLLAARNPNKVGIRYSAMRIFVLYRGAPIGVAAVPGFQQPAHSRVTVLATLAVDRVNVLQPNAVALLRDFNAGALALTVVGKVPARVTVLGVTTPRVQVGVSCQILIDPKKLQLVGKECGVKDVDL